MLLNDELKSLLSAVGSVETGWHEEI